MRIGDVVLICLVSLCFCEETRHNQTKVEIDEDELSRWKRAKIRPKDNQSLLRPDAIKISLNENTQQPKLRHELPKKIEPITNLKRVNTKTNVLPILPKINQNLRLPLPIPKAVNIHKNFEVPLLKIHNEEVKADFFVDKGDSEEIRVEKEHEKLSTGTKSVEPAKVEHNKHEIHSLVTPPHESLREHSHKPLHKYLHEHKPEPHDEKMHTESELKTEVNNTLRAEELAEHVKLPEHQLANEDKNTHDGDTLKDIIKQLPQIIQSLLAAKKTVSPIFIIHNTDADSPSVLTPQNFSRDCEVLKLLLKPILGNKQTKHDVDGLTEICWRNNIQNESINSIKILHNNYTEVTEKLHDCEKTHHPEHVDHCDHILHENIAGHSSLIGHENEHNVSSPLNTTSHETVYHDYAQHSHNGHLDGSAHNIHLHSLVPDLADHNHYTPDHTYTKPPYEYPTLENTKTYAFKANDNGQIKSGSVIDDDGKNTTWKTWTNTEVIIKTGKNNHADKKLEAKKLLQTPSYANQLNLLTAYKDLYHNVRLPGLNSIHRYNYPQLYNIQDQASPSYITYYPKQDKVYTPKEYEDSKIESYFDSHAV